ncbi:membrane protein [Psittacid alphaherpesvirus 1]|uniref:Protein UL20 n=1 Tax=Psittacid herpesvirus 1 (isolate Amazon parrot/-/97-0001/1997) TaxID=670426 RepID=UL20_PSHV1|nr:envelope protein UL20 [Psittacid alphaherpesvirus 1]Q6UDI5.1 RecName: Full=Protein UL20 [Psittacid herpesvirus 1 Amazon parrot/1997]AAQ73725.1 membrane protein [Psittacid alphaherpesvirus 1]
MADASAPDKKNAPTNALKPDLIKIAVERVLAAIDTENNEDLILAAAREPREVVAARAPDLFTSAAYSWSEEDELGTRMRASSFFPVASMFAKIICCLFLLWAKSCTGHGAMVTGLTACTGAYAIASLLCSFVVYYNVRTDNMPFGTYTKLFQIAACIGCGCYALGLTMEKLFGDSEMYFALFPDAKNSPLVGATAKGSALILPQGCSVAPYVPLAVSVAYCAAVVYDIADTIFPLLWVRTTLNEFAVF